MFTDFGDRGREGERNNNARENQDWLPPICAPTRNQTCNLGMYPDRGLNLQHFGVREDTPTK